MSEKCYRCGSPNTIVDLPISAAQVKSSVHACLECCSAYNKHLAESGEYLMFFEWADGIKARTAAEVMSISQAPPIWGWSAYSGT